jgi:DNA-binding transcriptional regulator YhcF (GntR family)
VASAIPPFEQVRAQLAAQITSGALVPGYRLPTVRGLATELGLAVNTVAKAYRDLETAGLIETRGRAGTVVSASGDLGRERLRQAAAAYAAVAHDVGIGTGEALRVVGAAFDQPDGWQRGHQ